MWLNNYYNFLFSRFVAANTVNGVTVSVPTIKSATGVTSATVEGTRTAGNYGIDSNANNAIADLFSGVAGATAYTGTTGAFANARRGLRLLVGSGRTAATPNDYAMERLITTGIQFAVTGSIDADTRTITTSVTVTNSGSDDLSIGEIGLAVSNYLLYRKALEDAIVLAGGESIVVTIKTNLANGVVAVEAEA